MGDEVSQKVSAQATALGLNPEVYKALQAVDAEARTGRRSTTWSTRCWSTG